MKFFLAILSTAWVIQISMAAAVQKDSYEVMKEMSANLKPMIQAVIRDMPTSVAYRKYKQDWESVLQKYDENRAGENCVDKVNRIIQAFGSAIRNYLKKNTNDAEKEMLRLFNQHGFESFTNKYGQMLQNAKDPQYDVTERC